jgi:hypothetical protein
MQDLHSFNIINSKPLCQNWNSQYIYCILSLLIIINIFIDHHQYCPYFPSLSLSIFLNSGVCSNFWPQFLTPNLAVLALIDQYLSYLVVVVSFLPYSRPLGCLHVAVTCCFVNNWAGNVLGQYSTVNYTIVWSLVLSLLFTESSAGMHVITFWKLTTSGKSLYFCYLLSLFVTFISNYFHSCCHFLSPFVPFCSHFLLLSVTFSHFLLSLSVTFSHFQSLSDTFCHFLSLLTIPFCHYLSLSITFSHYLSLSVTIQGSFTPSSSWLCAVVQCQVRVWSVLAWKAVLVWSALAWRAVLLLCSWESCSGRCHKHVLCTPMPLQSIIQWCTTLVHHSFYQIPDMGLVTSRDFPTMLSLSKT